MTWDDETTNAAVELWQSGYSASQIASKIGFVSRNAVIGRLHRMGLSKGTPRRQNTAATSKARKPRVSTITGRQTVHKNPAPVILPLPPPHVDDIARVALVDLENHHCRFPVGEPTTGFCGLQKTLGSAYCAGHHARCNHTVEVRKPATAKVLELV